MKTPSTEKHLLARGNQPRASPGLPAFSFRLVQIVLEVHLCVWGHIQGLWEGRWETLGLGARAAGESLLFAG